MALFLCLLWVFFFSTCSAVSGQNLDDGEGLDDGKGLECG